MTDPVDQRTDALSVLIAHVKALTDNMDRAGGDGYGMPECPWCRAQDSRDGDDKWHHGDCELAAARAALSALSSFCKGCDEDLPYGHTCDCECRGIKCLVGHPGHSHNSPGFTRHPWRG